jgi:4'-phosphopantetheinyl transferase
MNAPRCVDSEIASLTDGDVHVWQVDLDSEAPNAQDLLPFLDQAERLRAGRYRLQRDRRRFIVARGMLRWLLSRYVHIRPESLEFSYGPYGKPLLASASGGHPIHFNLSHSGPNALYAVACDRQVGIDLERIPAICVRLPVAAQVFCHNERHILLQLPRQQQRQAWLQYWTRKEAYVKARGNGLSYPLHLIDVSSISNGIGVLQCSDNRPAVTQWTLLDLSVGPAYAASLAVEGLLDLTQLSLQSDLTLGDGS